MAAFSAAFLLVFALGATGSAVAATSATGGSGTGTSQNGTSGDHGTSGTSGTSGDPSQPQPTSTADDNSGGANGQCPGGPYCSTRDGSPSKNGNDKGKATGKPCAGCVGKADNKNPHGQMPNGSDHNNGYECDGNNGVGKSNPAHTGCTSSSPSCAPSSDSADCQPVPSESCAPNSDSTDCPSAVSGSSGAPAGTAGTGAPAGPGAPAGTAETPGVTSTQDAPASGPGSKVLGEHASVIRPAADVAPRVAPAAAATGGTLPNTGAGAALVPIAAAGAVLLLGGGGLVLAGRRRRRA